MTDTERHTRRSPDATIWTITAVLMAISGFVALIISARALPQVDNGDFLVLWSLLFGFTGALAAIQAEASRAASPTADSGSAPVGGDAPLVGGALMIGGIAAGVVTLTGPWWLPLFGVSGSPWPVLGALALGIASYAGQSAAVGALMGGQLARSASVVVSAEAIVRLVLFGTIAWLAASVHGFVWASVLPMLVWPLALAVSGTWRTVWEWRAPLRLSTYLRNGIYAVAAGACTSILVNGYPAILRATADATSAEISDLPAIILAVTLTRAPLLLPLLAFQGVIVAYLVRHPSGIRRILFGLLGVVTLAGVGMAVLGPWVMRLLYGIEYDLPASSMVLFTVGAGSTATLVVAAASALAASRHRLYLTAWIVGTITSLSLLFTPIGLTERVTVSLTVGPLLGAALVWLCLQFRARTVT